MQLSRFIPFIYIVAFSSFTSDHHPSQKVRSTSEATLFVPSHQRFNDAHARYREKTITNRRFKHSNIVPLIEKLRNNSQFEVSKVGLSTQGRDIYRVKIGKGKTKVLLWSQMHGDEPTATMAT